LTSRKDVALINEGGKYGSPKDNQVFRVHDDVEWIADDSIERERRFKTWLDGKRTSRTAIACCSCLVEFEWDHPDLYTIIVEQAQLSSSSYNLKKFAILTVLISFPYNQVESYEMTR
jgi:hypothetical protein